MTLIRAFVFLALGAWLSGLAFSQNGVQTPSESFTIHVSGQKTWGIQVGFGDPTLLSLEGLTPGELTLAQSLWAQIEGKVLDFLTLKASFNDQLGPGFQDFLVIVDRKPWYAELGRFVVGAEGDALGVYNKKVLGARVKVGRENLGLSALLARLEGISESLVFRGTTGHAEVVFPYEAPVQPWLPAPYLTSVEGLFFLELRWPFVEGFSAAALALRTDQAFSRFLANWGLDYLREIAEKNATITLASSAYLIIEDEASVLLLRQEPNVLLRNRVYELIDLYNAAQGLSGANKKSYPFVEGSELEDAFLSGLAEFAEVRVDQEPYPLRDARRHRYLGLGETKIVEDSLLVEVRLPGETEFRSLTDPALSAYAVRLFPAQGVLRLDFPAEFFRAGAALRVNFDYTREGGTFFLGLSLIPGSERVYLNGQLLTRNTDYSIDYEAGLLTLFVSVGPADEVRVDFERQRGGLGVPTEYERYFLGASLEWDQGALGVWQAADVGSPSPTSRTMPNTHSLAVFSWQGKLGDWTYALRLGFSQNVFPLDDNARLPGLNRINAIVSVRTADGDALVFAHQNGITVYRNGRFSAYGSAEGLAGRAALSLLPLPLRLLIGTDSGLTVVELSEPGAFDRVRSWTRLYPEDWNKERPDKIQGTRVLALAQDGTQVYMATEAELLVIPISSLTKPKDWFRQPLPPGTPTVLLWAQELYLGSTEGLFRWGASGWERLGVPGPVYALLQHNRELLVAGEEGIRVLRDGVGAGWLAYGSAVWSLAVWLDRVWYTAPTGVYREGEQVLTGNFTVLGVGMNGLWAGTRADTHYQLDLWRVAPEVQRFPQAQTAIDGRDLGQFSDPRAEEHTRVGPTASLALSRKKDDWELVLSFFSRFPGYEEIGTSSRSDSHGLSFTARFLGDPALSLSLRGQAGLADLTSQPSLRLSGGVEGQWKGPFTLNFSLSPTWRKLAERAQLSSDFQVGAKAGSNPAWNLSMAGRFTAPGVYLAGTIRGELSYQPWPDLSLSAVWSRPYRSEGSAGTENLTLRGRLVGGQEYAWAISWEESFSHPLGRPEWTSSRMVSGELRLARLQFGAGKLAPRFSATATYTPAEWRLSGTAVTDVEVSSHRLNLQVTLGQGFRPATERTDRAFSLSFSWFASAWPNVEPRLTYTRSWKILLHPRYAPQVSEDQALEARVGFNFEKGRNEIVLSWSPGSGLQLLGRLRYDWGFGPLIWETSATWKGQKISGKSELEAAFTLAPQWGLNLRGGLLFGASPLRAAAYVGATLAANF